VLDRVPLQALTAVEQESPAVEEEEGARDGVARVGAEADDLKFRVCVGILDREILESFFLAFLFSLFAHNLALSQVLKKQAIDRMHVWKVRSGT